MICTQERRRYTNLRGLKIFQARTMFRLGSLLSRNVRMDLRFARSHCTPSTNSLKSMLTYAGRQVPLTCHSRIASRMPHNQRALGTPRYLFRTRQRTWAKPKGGFWAGRKHPRPRIYSSHVHLSHVDHWDEHRIVMSETTVFTVAGCCERTQCM